MRISELNSLSLLTAILSFLSTAASQGLPGQNGKPDQALCVSSEAKGKCTLGINFWYNVPDGPNQPASTGEYGGASINEVKFFDPDCKEQGNLQNWAPPDDVVTTTLTPSAPYHPLTLQGTSMYNTFALSPNQKLDSSSYAPDFKFTYDGTEHLQAGGCRSECSCFGVRCERKTPDGQKYSGWCNRCTFDCKAPSKSRIMRA